MAKASYESFVREKLVSNDLAENSAAKKIFDFLNEDERIYNAIQMSKIGKPALLANVEDLENFADENNLHEKFNLAEDINRMTIGRMQKTILAPFGWVPIQGSQKNFKAKYFRSASCYEFVEDKAEMATKVVVFEK